jgi:hypothetical protein
VLPWATEQNFSVRCTALASLTVLWRKYSFSVESVVGQLGREQRGAVQVLVENARAEFHAVEAVVRFGEQMKTPGYI